MLVVITIGDIAAQLDHVDDFDVLQQAEANPLLKFALEMSRPENWWGTGLRPTQLLPIAEDEGIPVAWVPPAPVLQALAAAPRSEHIPVLRIFRNEVLSQCQSLIDSCCDPSLSDSKILLERALAAFQAGFYEAAMALAVAVGEGLALWLSKLPVGLFTSETTRKEWDNEKSGTASRDMRSAPSILGD